MARHAYLVHVHADGATGCTDPLGGEEYIKASTGPEVNNRLALGCLLAMA
jgi:hypothetical protein